MAQVLEKLFTTITGSVGVANCSAEGATTRS